MILLAKPNKLIEFSWLQTTLLLLGLSPRTTTILRDSNPVECSAIKATCCGCTPRTLPSCGPQWSHRGRGRRSRGRRAHNNHTTGFESRRALGNQGHLLRVHHENTPFLWPPMEPPRPRPPSARQPYYGILLAADHTLVARLEPQHWLSTGQQATVSRYRRVCCSLFYEKPIQNYGFC